MKFLVLFLASAAFVSAALVGGKNIDVNEDGTIYIKGEDGKQIHITKHYGPFGQRHIEIEVTGPNNFAKMYQVDYNNKAHYGNGIGSQIMNIYKNYQDKDILDVIFKEYLGDVDESSYQQLLTQVEKAVMSGYFDDKFLYILKALVEDSKWDSLVSGQTNYGQFGGLLNKMTQQNKYGLGFFGKLFKGQGIFGQDYNQYDVQYYYNVLMKVFDRTVLKNVLVQEQMVNQEMYGQYSYEKMWDVIFTHEGIFDYEYLVQIISNEVLRNWFVQHGFFDKVVLDQILYTYQTKGTYDHHLFERLFNTQTLKYFFIKHGVSAYDILGQTSYNQYNAQYYYNVLMKVFDRKVLKTILPQQQMYNQEMYGQYSHEKMWDMIFTHEGIFDYEYLVQIVSNEVLRNWFVQHGFFDKVVLDQLLYTYQTKGTYDQHLFERLFNTQTLKYFFIKHGVSAYDILGQTSYNQYNAQYYYNVLMKVFDRKVLKTILLQQQMYNQEMYGQYSHEKMWDMIFIHEGIFDYEYLVQIISNEVLRNWFVQHGFFDKVVLDQILYTYQTKGTYDQHLFERLFNTQSLKYFFIKHGVSAYDILGQTSYNQYNAQYYYNVLMKVFDRKVLKNILDQEQIYNQEMYGQYSHEKMWDMIFTHEGIFDYEYLVQIISNEVLRNWFVQHGFFDKVVLDQLLHTYQTKGTYDQHLFERLFNTQTLKYFFIKHGVSAYDILGQTSYNQYFGSNLYNKGLYGNDMLERILNEPVWRNVMVQYGIFYRNILNQILYRYNTEGVYDQVLLRQLVNKQALYKVLVQYGIDETLLRQFVANEYLGLNFLFKNNFLQQTPRMTYSHLAGAYENVPEYNNYMYGGNYMKNWYGKQLYGYNQGPYTYGKYYHQYPITQQVY